MNPTVHRIPGELPPFWQERRAIFFANLLSLFFGNEGETQALRREVGRIASYGGRLLPILGTLFKNGGSLLVVDQRPNEALARYFRDDLGLELPEVEVLSHDQYDRFAEQLGDEIPFESEAMEQIALHPAEWVDGFVTDPYIAKLAQGLGKSTLSGVEASRRGNNKLLLHRFLAEAGLPVFETLETEHPRAAQAAWGQLQARGYRRAVAKAPVGASGIGMEIIRSDAEAAALPDYLFAHGTCMVQGWIEPGADGILEVFSPSVQIFTDHDNVYLYDITEQILSEQSVHQGNESPPRYFRDAPDVKDLLLDQAERVACWLNQQQYRGTASVDFLLLRRAEGWQAIVCEVNARVTGATYPAVLARKFQPGGAWVMRNLKLAAPMEGRDILDALRKEKRLYLPGAASGVLPINFNLNSQAQVDKGQFLCMAADTESCWRQIEELEGVLPLAGSFDRE